MYSCSADTRLNTRIRVSCCSARQERKRELANAAFDRRSADANRQMKVDDVRLLMDL